jgi:hypothetical protein
VNVGSFTLTVPCKAAVLGSEVADRIFQGADRTSKAVVETSAGTAEHVRYAVARQSDSSFAAFSQLLTSCRTQNAQPELSDGERHVSHRRD